VKKAYLKDYKLYFFAWLMGALYGLILRLIFDGFEPFKVMMGSFILGAPVGFKSSGEEGSHGRV
jgi:hypothetical protein